MACPYEPTKHDKLANQIVMASTLALIGSFPLILGIDNYKNKSAVLHNYLVS